LAAPKNPRFKGTAGFRKYRVSGIEAKDFKHILYFNEETENIEQRMWLNGREVSWRVSNCTYDGDDFTEELETDDSQEEELLDQ
jgi:hypothetical protein